MNIRSTNFGRVDQVDQRVPDGADDPMIHDAASVTIATETAPTEETMVEG